MLYGTEACPVMSRHRHSLDFAVNQNFCTGSKQTVEECQKYFVFLPMSHGVCYEIIIIIFGDSI